VNREARRAILLRLFRGVPDTEWHPLNFSLGLNDGTTILSSVNGFRDGKFYMWASDEDHDEYLAEHYCGTRAALVSLYGPEGGEDLDWILALAKIEEAQ